MSKAGLNHANARTKEQVELMAKIEADGVCPFCSEHFKKYHPKPILKETEYWYVTENISPYEGTSYHFLFVYKPAHITIPSEILPSALVNLFDLVSGLIKEYDMKGGGFFMRFGDTKWNASSVEHIHAHIIVGGEEGVNKEKIKVPLGWKI
jgi:diadenosine tetraphosphate (Ap4A) HIT family hydrolase